MQAGRERIRVASEEQQRLDAEQPGLREAREAAERAARLAEQRLVQVGPICKRCQPLALPAVNSHKLHPRSLAAYRRQSFPCRFVFPRASR